MKSKMRWIWIKQYGYCISQCNAQKNLFANYYDCVELVFWNKNWGKHLTNCLTVRYIFRFYPGRLPTVILSYANVHIKFTTARYLISMPCSYLKLCRKLFVLMTVLVYLVLAGDELLPTTGHFVIRLMNILGVANFRTSTLSPFFVWTSSGNSVFASLREKFHC